MAKGVAIEDELWIYLLYISDPINAVGLFDGNIGNSYGPACNLIY